MGGVATVAGAAPPVYDPQDGSTKPPEETRMHLHLPNTERLSESTRTAREAFWLTIICGVAVYAFFMVIGSVSPSGAAVATLVAGGPPAGVLGPPLDTARRM